MRTRRGEGVREDEWAEKQRNTRSRGVGVVISLEARAGLGMVVGGEKSSVFQPGLSSFSWPFSMSLGGGKDRRRGGGPTCQPEKKG